MPDHYSPKLFLQQVPSKLLRQAFTPEASPTTEGAPIVCIDAVVRPARTRQSKTTPDSSTFQAKALAVPRAPRQEGL